MSLEAPVQTVWCTQCGQALTQSDLVHIAGNWVCANCKPAFLSRIMASGAAGATPLGWHYGGFWIRFAGAKSADVTLNLYVPLNYPFAARPVPSSRMTHGSARPTVIALAMLPLGILFIGNGMFVGRTIASFSLVQIQVLA